jgi:hypothetical protein
MIAPSVMSLPALPAFDDDCIGHSDELAAILVTRRVEPRRDTASRSQRSDREQRRNFAPVSSPAHTGGHTAYVRLAGASESTVAGRATLLDWRRSDRGEVLAAPRAWKNDFR